MAASWITAEQLENRLPGGGEGLAAEEIQEAIDSAVEYVEGVCGGEAEQSAICRSAAASLAQADCEAIIWIRDGREVPDSVKDRRDNAEASLSRYGLVKEIKDSGDPDPDNIPDGYVGVMW